MRRLEQFLWGFLVFLLCNFVCYVIFIIFFLIFMLLRLMHIRLFEFCWYAFELPTPMFCSYQLPYAFQPSSHDKTLSTPLQNMCVDPQPQLVISSPSSRHQLTIILSSARHQLSIISSSSRHQLINVSTYWFIKWRCIYLLYLLCL